METETRKTPAAAEGKGVIPLRIPSTLGNTPPSIDIGDQLGRYLIISRLHESETSVVYTGHDTELDRTVAIKALRPPQSRDGRELLRHQAKMLARINSPHVVTLYEMLDLPAGPALVMEYLVGRTLAQKLYNQARLNLQEASKLFAQALIGLERIHRLGIVHGDLKPDNIFITTDHAVKLLDFRLARYLDKAGSSTDATNLLYAAPEQLNGKPADFRSDLYTLGVSLYEAVNGGLPFEANEPEEAAPQKISNHKPAREITTPFAAVLQKATEKDPGKRFQSAREFRHALMEALCGVSLNNDRPAKTSFSFPALSLLRGRTWLGGIRVDIALIATIVMFVVALGLYPGKEKPKQEIRVLEKQKKEAVPNYRRSNPNNQNPSPDPYKELRKAWSEN
jgi:serine/threonine-protein kinase